MIHAGSMPIAAGPQTRRAETSPTIAISFAHRDSHQRSTQLPMSRPPATPLSPAEQIEVIERSLRCFVSGLFALLPGLGLIPAGYVFWTAHRVRSRCRGVWNPASHYVNLGVWCACAGLLLMAVAAGLSLAAASNDGSRSIWYGPLPDGD